MHVWLPGGQCGWGPLRFLPLCWIPPCSQVSSYGGWKDNISSMGWWAVGTLCWFWPHSPCPRLLAITTTAGQLPSTLPATAASAAAPGKTCWSSVPTESSWSVALGEPETHRGPVWWTPDATQHHEAPHLGGCCWLPPRTKCSPPHPGPLSSGGPSRENTRPQVWLGGSLVLQRRQTLFSDVLTSVEPQVPRSMPLTPFLLSPQ